MSIEVNATEQIIEVNATGSTIDINVSSQTVDVNATTSVIEVTASYNPGINLPNGGTTGQVLKKQSNTDYDTYWATDEKGVPYVGATGDVDLGEYELKAGQLTLDTSPTGTAAVGTTRWNDTIGSSETTLKGGSVILKNGVDLVARVVNKVTPNTTLTKASYQAVKVSGAQGQRLAIALAQANNDNNSADTLGLVIETIATNQEGFIMTVGTLEGVNTTGSLQGETWADGDVLYLSPTIAGALTNIKPNGSTGHIVVIGYVEYAHANNGKIYVKIMNGWELDELHNVYITSPANSEVLTYESATSLWKNKTIATALGYTPVPTTRSLTINGTSYDLSADRSWTVSGSNIYNADGTLTGNRTVTSGGFNLTFTGSNTASGAIARGLNLTHTLVAAANNDVLVGLDINPTFTNGVFTGLTNAGLRVGGSSGLLYDIANTRLNIGSGAGSITNVANINIKFSSGVVGTSITNNSTTGQAGMWLTNNINAIASFFKNGSALSSYRTILAGDAGIYNGDSGDIVFQNDNTAGKIKFGIGSSSDAKATLTAAGRLLLGTTTESTYLLDVNGTGRFTGNVDITGSSILTTRYLNINSSGQAARIEFTYSGGTLLQLGRMQGTTGTNRIFNIISKTTDFGATNQELLTLFPSGSIQYNNFAASAGNTAIETVSSCFEIASTTKGFLPPRMTAAQKTAISTPATGLVIYQTDSTEGLYQYKSTGWEAIGGGGTNIYNSDGTLTGNRTVTLSTNTLTFAGSYITVSNNANSGTYLKVSNTTSGTAAQAYTQFESDATAGFLNIGKRSNTFTQVGIINSADSFIENTTKGDISIRNAFSSGKIKLATGSATTSTASVVGSTFIVGGDVSGSGYIMEFATSANAPRIDFIVNSVYTGQVSSNGSAISIKNNVNNSGVINFNTTVSSVDDTRFRIFNNGNVLIQNGGTFTDAGYKLDVQGTARVTGQLTLADSVNTLKSTNDFNINYNVSKPFTVWYGTEGAISVNPTSGDSVLIGKLTGTTYALRTTDITKIASLIISNSNNIYPASGTLNLNYPNTNDTYIYTGTTIRLAVFNSTGNIGVGNSNTDIASAILHASSTTKGFLPPRMTETQKNAISTPATGLVIYQTDGTEGLYQYKSTGWSQVAGTGGGGGISRSVNVISTTTTAGASASTDYVYLISGTTTLTLPTAVGNTNRYTLKNVGTNTVTINTTSSQTIDGSTSITMAVQYTALDVISDGTNWNII